MSNKYKFFSVLFIILLLFFVGSTAVEKQNTNSLVTSIESIMPQKIKNILKNTIFILPTLKKKINYQEERLIKITQKNVDLKKKTLELERRMNFFHIKLSLPALESKKIKSKSNNYNLKLFELPFLASDSGKPLSYIDESGNNIIMVTGYGEFFFLQKQDLEADSLNLNKIKTNLQGILDSDFFISNSGGVRDLLILDNKILFSFTKKQSSDCYNTSIMMSELNYDYLDFSEFFSYKECTKDEQPSTQSGGRIVAFKNGKILLTIGDYGDRVLAQNVNSKFGKIISVDLKTKKYEIVAMGSRNAQGLYYEKKNDIIVHTEHGPLGGDEININKNSDSEIIENYGWPISSYGEHYDGQFREEAPLRKSHSDYGFIEPIKYFSKSVAISEIAKIPKSFNEKSINDFFVGTLGNKHQINDGARTLYHFRFDENFNKVTFEDSIPVGERIRDIIFIKDKNVFLLILESIPAIGVLNLIN